MSEVRWLDEAEAAAWTAYLRSTQLLLQLLDRQLEEDANISLTDYEVLANLSQAPEHRMRMRELAAATLSTRSGATRAVTRLERAGWVRRVSCGDDRRGMFAELTDAGATKLASSAPGHVAAVRAHMIDLISRDEAAQVRRIGERMLAHQPAIVPAEPAEPTAPIKSNEPIKPNEPIRASG